MPKANRKKVQKPAYELYTITIVNWTWSFHFGLDKGKWAEGPYSDYRSIEIDGTVWEPERFIAWPCSATLSPSIKDNELESRDEPPNSIGYMDKHDDWIFADATMPRDALPSVLTALTVNAVRYLHHVTTRMRYRKALVTSFSLQSKADDE